MEMKFKLKKCRVIVGFLFMLMCVAFAGCGRGITNKDLEKVQKQYEDGKISVDYYHEVMDAAYNGDPMPPKTFVGKIWRGITNFLTSVIGFIFEVIGLLVGLGILALIFGKKK